LDSPYKGKHQNSPALVALKYSREHRQAYASWQQLASLSAAQQALRQRQELIESVHVIT